MKNLLICLTLLAPAAFSLNQNCDPCREGDLYLPPLMLNHCEAGQVPERSCTDDCRDDHKKKSEEINETFCAFKQDAVAAYNSQLLDCANEADPVQCRRDAQTAHQDWLCTLEDLRQNAQKGNDADYENCYKACPCVDSNPMVPGVLGVLNETSPFSQLIPLEDSPTCVICPDPRPSYLSLFPQFFDDCEPGQHKDPVCTQAAFDKYFADMQSSYEQECQDKQGIQAEYNQDVVDCSIAHPNDISAYDECVEKADETMAMSTCEAQDKGIERRRKALIDFHTAYAACPCVDD